MVDKLTLGSSQNSGADGGRSRDLLNVICHSCKEKGHFKRDCPKGGNQNQVVSPELKAWRAAPKPNEPHTKTGKNGKKCLWCKKCFGGRWTLTHLTKDHQARPRPGQGAAPAANLAAFKAHQVEDQTDLQVQESQLVGGNCLSLGI